MATLRRSGKLTFLRAHELGGGFGPDTDFIDVEAVARITAEPDHSFGFEMQDDARLPAHEAMFALLVEGFSRDWDITVDYDLEDGRRNGVLIRVELRK